MRRRACRRVVPYAALVVVRSIITGCGSGSTTGPSSSAGTLTIRLTDSPFKGDVVSAAFAGLLIGAGTC